MNIAIKVNGTLASDDVEPGELLVDYLRSSLGLTSAKVGCETGHCGACVLRFDGRTVKSCLVLAVQADGASVETVEGLSADSELTPLQEAMLDEHAAQCGFCTPGMVMSLTELLDQHPHPDEGEIRSWLSGNICRCTGYQSIVRAALRARGRAENV
jgi:carbon-monoxide dehydrogenase small subunit